MDEKFEVKPHSVLPEKQIVEYYRDGEFTAGIYPHEDGIRIVSKYMTGVTEDPTFPQSAVIMLEPTAEKK